MNLKNVIKTKLLFPFLFLFTSIIYAQAPSWQQKVNYVMEIDFDNIKNQFKGKQKLDYWNNSPDTLIRIYYHLYYNAFQPGSMMDIRSRTIKDPDPRVGDRILKLSEDQIGYQKILSLKKGGKPLQYFIDGTIMEVILDKPILPSGKITIDLEFESQVPVQIRRTGRNNAEGIAYSMTQWYPKLCEYDQDGWHTDQYVAREFHGVWGDFDVKIAIDSSFTIGGTGYLQNPQEIGHGYEDNTKPLKRPKSQKLVWHFKAPMVHDFAWVADPEFVHDIQQVPGGPTLHFLYQGDTLVSNWKKVEPVVVKSFQIANSKFGAYPYKQYSIIQGGDGGMEYPMATLITSNGTYSALLSVIVHESMHSWFQGVLATNESKYAWMDEGFTRFAQYFILDSLNNYDQKNPHSLSYSGYINLVRNGVQEASITHSDFYNSNSVYTISTYYKGAIFLHQLSYIIGKETFWKGIKRYYDEWKFKHPTPVDFKRVMEKISGIELDWYLEQWVESTNSIDYGIKTVESNEGVTKVTLEKKGRMPMPLDINVYYKDGTKATYYIPLQLMRGGKNEIQGGKSLINMNGWPWAYPEYTFAIPSELKDIKYIEIDSSTRMADVDRENNVFPYSDSFKFFGEISK